MLNGKGKQSWLVGSNILAHITCCLTFRTHCAHTFHKTPGYRNLGYVQIGTLFPMLFWHQFEHTPSSETQSLNSSEIVPAYSGNSAIPKFKCFSSYILGLSMPRNLKAATSWLGNPVLGFPNVGIWETRLSKVLGMWHSNLKKHVWGVRGPQFEMHAAKKGAGDKHFFGAWNLNLSQQRRSLKNTWKNAM